MLIIYRSMYKIAVGFCCKVKFKYEKNTPISENYMYEQSQKEKKKLQMVHILYRHSTQIQIFQLATASALTTQLTKVRTCNTNIKRCTTDSSVIW